MHKAARSFVAAVLPTLPVGAVLEIGARNINGHVRDLCAPRPYVGIDLAPGPGVDRVASGADFVPDDPPLIVLCLETLEHTPEAAAICAHVYDILQPGGVFVITAAGEGRAPHSAVDGSALRSGEFYENLSADALEHWLAPFASVAITIEAVAHDIYAVATKAAHGAD